MGQVRVLIAYV